MSSARYAIERMRSSMRPYTALAPRRRLRVGEEQILPRFRLVLDALDRGHEVGEAADPGWGDLVAEIGVRVMELHRPDQQLVAVRAGDIERIHDPVNGRIAVFFNRVGRPREMRV